jgi:hypothetical protein
VGSTITNAANFPLNFRAGTVPDVSGALTDWFQPMAFVRVQKSAVGYQALETGIVTNFRGVIQPLSARRLILKPEGQRAWSWFQLHADTSLVLSVDDVVMYQGVQTRVMAKSDFQIYGYVEYELVQDYTLSGPTIVTPPYASVIGGLAYTLDSEFDYELDGGNAFTTTFDSEIQGGTAYAD